MLLIGYWYYFGPVIQILTALPIISFPWSIVVKIKQENICDSASKVKNE
jgi:hypothetical protein